MTVDVSLFKVFHEITFNNFISYFVSPWFTWITYITRLSAFIKPKISRIPLILAWQTICPQQSSSCCFSIISLISLTIQVTFWHPSTLSTPGYHVSTLSISVRPPFNRNHTPRLLFSQEFLRFFGWFTFKFRGKGGKKTTLCCLNRLLEASDDQFPRGSQ